jgi:hypothetical protein
MIYTALTGSGTDSSTEFQVRFTEKGENLEVLKHKPSGLVPNQISLQLKALCDFSQRLFWIQP